MRITATGCLAFVAAVGLWIGMSAPTQACVLLECLTTSAQTAAEPQPAAEPAGKPVALAKFTKRRTHHARQNVTGSHKVARNDRAARRSQSVSVSKRRAERYEAEQEKNAEAAKLPLAVANAQAKLGTGDATPSPTPSPAPAYASEPATTDSASDETPMPVKDGTQLVEADEVNEIDQAAAPPAAAPIKLASATIDQPQQFAGAQASVSSHSVWDQTSLIGKMFVAFGGVLMLASAMRLFIA
jgi:hypothetical protein